MYNIDCAETPGCGCVFNSNFRVGRTICCLFDGKSLPTSLIHVSLWVGNHTWREITTALVAFRSTMLHQDPFHECGSHYQTKGFPQYHPPIVFIESENEWAYSTAGDGNCRNQRSYPGGPAHIRANEIPRQRDKRGLGLNVWAWLGLTQLHSRPRKLRATLILPQQTRAIERNVTTCVLVCC